MNYRLSILTTNYLAFMSRRQCYTRQLSTTPRLEPSSLVEFPSTHFPIMEALSHKATLLILHDTPPLTGMIT